MKYRIVAHPLLFSIFVILFLFSHNIDQLSIVEMTLPFAVVVIISMLILVGLTVILRNSQKAGLIATLFLFMFFLYGHFFNATNKFTLGGFSIVRHRYLLPIWILIIVLSIFIFVKTKKPLNTVTKCLNISTSVLVLFSLFNIFLYKLRLVYSDVHSYSTETTSRDYLDSVQLLKDTPNIYYIILDGYANQHTLEELYNYDNSEFLNYLMLKGFYIASESQSNYTLTFLSLASSLNMKYINYLSETIGVESKDRTIPYQMIQNNKVMQFLKSRGYMFVHFRSGWGGTNKNIYADIDLSYGGVTELYLIIINVTMLQPFEKYLFSKPHRKRILRTFSQLAEVHTKVESPYFVFSHLLVPHPPFLFGPNGENVENSDIEMTGSVWQHKQSYLNQLMFVNKKVKILIEKILSESKSIPIIILQADHGPEFYQHSKNYSYERVRIFNAYLLPMNGDELFYNSITPVNTFRLIFNCYFNGNYELLKDKSYISSYQHPYEFKCLNDVLKR